MHNDPVEAKRAALRARRFRTVSSTLILGVPIWTISAYIIISSPEVYTLLAVLIANALYAKIIPRLLLSAVVEYIYSIQSKPRTICLSCKKPLPTEAGWKCGHCEYVNQDYRNHSFLHSCSACDRSPKSITCISCAKLVFLDSEGDDSYPATFAVTKRVEIAPALDDCAIEHEQKKKALQREIEIMQLTARLKVVKESAEFTQEVDARKALDAKFNGYMADVLGRQMLEQEQRKRIDAEFAHDPEHREMQHMALDTFLRDEGGEPAVKWEEKDPR